MSPFAVRRESGIGARAQREMPAAIARWLAQR